MSVKTKLEVEYSQFKSGMAEAQASVKTMDAELKRSEAQFRATGDAEKYLEDKTNALNQKLESQSQVVKSAEQMLLNLGKRGVSPTSVEYQKMAQKLLNAQAAMATTQAELNNLNSKQTDAAASAKTLGQEVSGIGKNVSLQNITDGLGKLTDGMEKAYRTAVRVGRAVVRSAMDATGWADDVMTRAVKYGVDAETIQKLDQVAAYIDTDVDTMISAKDRLSKNRETVAELLGISSDGKTVDEVFWEAGEAIKNLGEGFDQNEIAMKIFGKGWRDLLPLFTAGREQYEALMENQNVLSNEQVESLQKADDAFQSIQNEVENLKRTFWAEHSGTVIELLQWVVDNKESVIAALTAIGGAFAALKLAEVALNITKIVSGFKELNMFGGAGNPAQPTGQTPVGNPAQPTGQTPVGKTILNATGAMIMIDYDPAKSLQYQQEYGKQYAFAKMLDEDYGTNLYELQREWDANRPPVKVKPEAEEGSAEDLAAQIGEVTVPVNLRVNMGGSAFSGGGGGGGLSDYHWDAMFGSFRPGYANGIRFVPDTRLAWLHPGETVTPAREVSSRNYSSNLYVERMIMNNGTDANGLADAMAAAQRRTMSGYGS